MNVLRSTARRIFPIGQLRMFAEIAKVLQNHKEDIDAGEAKLFSDNVHAVRDEWLANKTSAARGPLSPGLHVSVRV
jgi:hypothetical protein